MDKNIKNIHFMGIGGSGMSGVAVLAQKMGFNVTGCDLEVNSSYTHILDNNVKNIYKGHDEKHLKDIDLLIVTPAVMFQNKDNKELKVAQEKNLVMTWQEFLGTYLMDGKRVIAVSGTHGKSTTTAMTSLILEKSGLDPNVVIGANVREWESNFRFGKGKYFVVEADEFYGNFLHYKPEFLIINNIEFDHPDYFSNLDDVVKTFKRLIDSMIGEKVIIANYGNDEVKKLIKEYINKDGYKVYSYQLDKKKRSRVDVSALQKDDSLNENIIHVVSKKLKIDQEFNLKLLGNHNIENALGVITISLILGVDKNDIKSVFSNFDGIGRRMELIGEKNGIKVYDDYAHHPTAIKATLEALRKKYPDNEIWCVVEPHSFSRTKSLLELYDHAFDAAEKVVIGPIFKARDTQDFGITPESIVQKAGHDNAIALDSIDKITKLIKRDVNTPAIVVVMGAGESYIWAKEILKVI